MTSVVAERPVCKCHGEPKLWHKDTRKRGGGHWQCAVKHRESSRRWRETNPDKHRESQRRWIEANLDKLAASNARRLFVCGIYVGKCGWTETEIKEITSGATH